MRPSAPTKIAKFRVACELGHRYYSEGFMTKADAAAFVQTVVKGEPLRWVNAEEATAKGGVLRIKADDLEDLVEMKKVGELRPEMMKAITQFLRGHWPSEVRTGEQSANWEHDEPKTTKKKVEKPGLVMLADLCKKHKWTTRAARMKLRSSKIKKPAGGWAWPSAEAKKVEAQLEEMMG